MAEFGLWSRLKSGIKSLFRKRARKRRPRLAKKEGLKKRLKFGLKKGGKRGLKRTKNPRLISAVEQKSKFESQVPARLTPLRIISDFSVVQLSPHTQRAYKRDLNDFFAFLRMENLFEGWANQVGPTEIAKYRDYLIHVKKLSKNSITRKLAVLKSFYKWCQAQNWIHHNPAELIRSFPQTQESKTGFLKEEEIFQLLNSLPQVTDERLSKALMRVGIECLLMLGLRRSEAASMRMGDLKFEGGQWLILIKGKGGRDRLLPMPPRLINTLSQWFYRITEEESPYQSMQDNPRAWLNFFSRRVDSPILISTRAKTYESPLSDSELARIVRKSGLKAGLIGKISPHMLRATAITYALDQGASHRGVQQMAGWTSPLMISRYDKRRKDPKFSAVHKLKYGFDGKKQKEAKLEESEGIKNTPEKDA